jgi:hypothetical protein
LLLALLGAIFWVLWRDYRATAEAAVETRRQRGRLVVIDADEADMGQSLTGAHFPLLPLTSLGRGPTNTVVLNDTFCSQEHALVTWRGGQWWLEDRNSSNGTRLNGEAVRAPVVVSSGDVIGIGRVLMKIELD